MNANVSRTEPKKFKNKSSYLKRIFNTTRPETSLNSPEDTKSTKPWPVRRESAATQISTRDKTSKKVLLRERLAWEEEIETCFTLVRKRNSIVEFNTPFKTMTFDDSIFKSKDQMEGTITSFPEVNKHNSSKYKRDSIININPRTILNTLKKIKDQKEWDSKFELDCKKEAKKESKKEAKKEAKKEDKKEDKKVNNPATKAQDINNNKFKINLQLKKFQPCWNIKRRNQFSWKQNQLQTFSNTTDLNNYLIRDFHFNGQSKQRSNDKIAMTLQTHKFILQKKKHMIQSKTKEVSWGNHTISNIYDKLWEEDNLYTWNTKHVSFDDKEMHNIKNNYYSQRWAQRQEHAEKKLQPYQGPIAPSIRWKNSIGGFKF